MPRAARPWFRFYVEAVHDRKLRRQKPEHRWLFVACLAAARQSCEPGWLFVGEDDPMGTDDLSDFAAMPPRHVEQGMAALSTTGVVEFDAVRGAWFIPAWDSRQFESDDVTARTTKHRKERSNDVPTNVPTSSDGTPSESESDTDTESSSSDSSSDVPETVWDQLARKKLAVAKNVTHQGRWLATVTENDKKLLGARAQELWETYEIPIGQLVDVLAAGGSSPSLGYLPKRKDPAA